MARHIDPPQEQWDRLPTPLTPGEREVFELFDAKLPAEWEMYIQPYLNGLRPDLVLLNPKVGIAVFEIKDCTLTTIQNAIEANRTTQNPFNQIKRYKNEILELYCPRLNDSFGHAAKQAITAGLIFTRIPQAEINRYRAYEMDSYPAYHPLDGSDSLAEGNMNVLFPEWQRRSSSYYVERNCE